MNLQASHIRQPLSSNRFAPHKKYLSQGVRVRSSAVAQEADVSLSRVIRPAEGLHELNQVARLRAEAFYEDDRSRFVETFKRQFTSQEAESLQQRTAPGKGSSLGPQCECLVALSTNSPDAVVGCIDIRLPHSITKVQPAGVPKEDNQGGYILNVVVEEDSRGQGIGKALMQVAMQRAVHTWGAKQLYTHVQADNEVAWHLYKSCGFEEHSSESKYSNTMTLGRLVLLQASHTRVPPPPAP